jgi:hypothetical protein
MNMLGPQGRGAGATGAALGGALAGATSGTAANQQGQVAKAPGTPQGPFMPPTARPGQPPTIAARLPQGAFFQPGSVVHGQVTSQDKTGSYNLRLGEHTLSAKSSTPLSVGQSVQFKVQGENQGQVMLQLVKTPFAKLDTQDLSTSLSQMRLPASDANVQLAKTMVEHSVPLTKENFTALLSQTTPPEGCKSPPPMQARVSAVIFMQQNQIPVTPQNMLSLSQFIAANPQIGQQMFQLSGELKGLTSKLDKLGIDLAKELPGIVGENGIKEKNKQSEPPKTPPKKLFDMAKQLGIETNLAPFAGDNEEEWDLMAQLRNLRQRSEQLEGGEAKEQLMTLFDEIESNLEAQKLINQARSDIGYFYLQIPLRLGHEGVEVWISYTNDEGGEKNVDPDDCRLEFLVTTENLGELFFVAEIQNNEVNLEIGTPLQEVRERLARFAPLLQERIEMLGYSAHVEVCYRADSGRRQLVESTEFDELEGCNVQA